MGFEMASSNFRQRSPQLAASPVWRNLPDSDAGPLGEPISSA